MNNTNLAQCTFITRGVKVKEDTSYGIDYYEINMKDFNGNLLNIPTDKKHNGSDDQIKLKQLEKGDIIIPVRGASISNKIAIFNLDTDIPCIVNHQYWIIKPDKKFINSYFLLFFLLNFETKNIINNDERNASKSGVITISKESLKDLIINLPSLDTQNKVKELFVQTQNLNQFIEETSLVQQNLCNSIYTLSDIESLQESLKTINSLSNKIEKIYSEINSLVS